MFLSYSMSFGDGWKERFSLWSKCELCWSNSRSLFFFPIIDSVSTRGHDGSLCVLSWRCGEGLEKEIGWFRVDQWKCSMSRFFNRDEWDDHSSEWKFHPSRSDWRSTLSKLNNGFICWSRSMLSRKRIDVEMLEMGSLSFLDSHQRWISRLCPRVQKKKRVVYRWWEWVFLLTTVAITSISNGLEAIKVSQWIVIWQGETNVLLSVNTSINKTDINSKISNSFSLVLWFIWNLQSKEDEDPLQWQQWWICSEDEHYWLHSTSQTAFPGVSQHDFSNRSSFIPSSCPSQSQSHPFLFLSFNATRQGFECFNRIQIGDGQIDCAGGFDERMTLPHCSGQPFAMLEENFLCPSSNICIPFHLHCLTNHQVLSMKRRFSVSMVNCSNPADVMEQSSVSLVKMNMHVIIPIVIRRSVRERKKILLKVKSQIVRLNAFPRDSNFTPFTSNSLSTATLSPAINRSSSSLISSFSRRQERINRQLFVFVLRNITGMNVNSIKIVSPLFFNWISLDRFALLFSKPSFIPIELYRRRRDKQSLLIALWRYPLAFDHLPVSRLAKVLHLRESFVNRRSSRSYHSYERCQPLMNNPSQSICLCTGEYFRSECQSRRRSIRLSVSLSSPEHRGAVSQYLRIDFVSLDVHLVDEQVIKTFRQLVEYFYSDSQTSPLEIVLAKLYSTDKNSIPADLFLLSVHLNISFLTGATQISEINRCDHQRTLSNSYLDPLPKHSIFFLSRFFTYSISSHLYSWSESTLFPWWFRSLYLWKQKYSRQMFHFVISVPTERKDETERRWVMKHKHERK